MPALLSAIDTPEPTLTFPDQAPARLAGDQRLIHTADQLLQLYLACEAQSPLMPLLTRIRQQLQEDLDQVETVAEVYGLMYWLMEDYAVDNRGESLEETADRLGDIDIENDSDQYGDLIFHLKDAVERLYDLELE
ncbi:hypothetical protein [Neptuniibacter halophilus]|uniref:hypothetical protein n=1 Tax=Neptuniibacter halophilus TaxID=651666 RepID=UPI002573DDDC|nr:hypothetical protein [Neptuniibacter halophilus]